MHTEKLQAFVLSTLDYADCDRIVSLFTLEHGRVRCFARGARNSRKRFGAALEPFTRIEVQIRLKEGGLSGLQQADIGNIYPGIRLDLARIAHALYACELIDAITPEGQPLARLFRLQSAYLDRLESEPASNADRRFFEINLLNILGYRPSLDACSRCASPFNGMATLLPGGELICRFCTSGGRRLDETTLKVLRSCLATGAFGLIAFPEQALEQAGILLDEAISAHAGRKLKSLDFLRQVAE